MRRSLRVLRREPTIATASSKSALNTTKRINTEDIDSFTVTKRTKKALDLVAKDEAGTSVGEDETICDKKPFAEQKTTAKQKLTTNSKMSKKEAEKETTLMNYLDALTTRRSATLWTKKLIGAHVSGAGGLENAVFNAAKIGARSFALFTRSQRSWTCKPMTEDTIIAFKQAMDRFGYSPNDVVPHGSYLFNCGSPDKDVLAKSRAGIENCNIHIIHTKIVLRNSDI
jgi:hypothetical protein